MFKTHLVVEFANGPGGWVFEIFKVFPKDRDLTNGWMQCSRKLTSLQRPWVGVLRKDFSITKLLWTAIKRHTTYQELAVSVPRIGEMFLDDFFSDKANATFPTWRRVVENVKYFETLLVDIHEFFEVISQQNVFLIYISVDQGNCCTIGRVLEGGTDDLNHRRNTSTARNHAEVTNEVRGIEKIALWSFNTKSITYLEVSDVARDIAFFICLEEC